MRARLMAGTACIDLEAVAGRVCISIMRPGQGGVLDVVSNALTTDEAADLIEALSAVACIAEEQAYHAAVELALTLCHADHEQGARHA